MKKINYKKGQKITGIKTKKDLEQKLKAVREKRLAYPGGKAGAYTITVGAAKAAPKKPVKKAAKKAAKKKKK